MSKSYTQEEFLSAVDASSSIKETLERLGLSTSGQSYRTFYRSVESWQVDYSHFDRGRSKFSDSRVSSAKPVEDYLRLYDGRTSPYPASHFLKRKLYKSGLKEPRCEICHIEEWQGHELTMHLDHINGHPWDNRLENLRILCPNCHSQTPTFCGKNRQRHPKQSKHTCKLCSGPATRRDSLCTRCHHANLERVAWPDTETLKALVAGSSYSAVARSLGVSDNAVRKRLRNH